MAAFTNGPRHWHVHNAVAATPYAIPSYDLGTKYEVDPTKAQYSQANIILIKIRYTQITT